MKDARETAVSNRWRCSARTMAAKRISRSAWVDRVIVIKGVPLIILKSYGQQRTAMSTATTMRTINLLSERAINGMVAEHPSITASAQDSIGTQQRARAWRHWILEFLEAIKYRRASIIGPRCHEGTEAEQGYVDIRLRRWSSNYTNTNTP